jgi:hypothetical protein
MEAINNETIQAGQPEDDDEYELEQEVLKNLREGRRHRSEWRKEARIDYDYLAGRQWDEEDVAKLKEEKRPAVTFNRVLRILNAFTGIERQNRQEVNFSPMEASGSSDSALAEMMNNAAKWVRKNCQAEYEESEAYLDCGTCGEGWIETRIDYEVDSEGKIMIDRIDPLEMLVDPESKKRNYVDARWMARVKEVSRKELIDMNFAPTDIQNKTFWNDAEATQLSDFEEERYHGDDSNKLSKQGNYTLVQYQYFKRSPFVKVEEQSGKIIEVPAEQFARVLQFVQSMGLKYVEFKKRVYYQCFLLGNKIVEKKQLGCDNFEFSAITGLRDKNKNYWFGLVRIMRDPQMWANKWLSQIQHILNSGAKNGLIAEQGTIPNIRKFEANFAKPGSVTEVAPGALSNGRIIPKEAPRFPDGVDRLLQYALQAINDVTGVNLELIGLANRDQPIGLEDLRKQAGITIIATFFDSLSLYREVQGRVLVYFIQEYISDGRLIRVLGQEGAKYVPLVKDAVSFKYDILVGDAPTSPNMKERTFLMLKELLPLVMQAGIPIPPDVLDYAPLPDGLVQKWKAMLRPDDQQQKKSALLDQIKATLAQLEVLEKDKEIDKKSSEIVLNYAKAQQASAIGQDEAAQSMQKMGLTNREHEIKSESMMQEQKRKDMEMWLDHGRKLLETELNAKIKSRADVT